MFYSDHDLAAAGQLRAILADPDRDDEHYMIRALMIDRDDFDGQAYPELGELVDGLSTDERSDLALDLSLCPLHLVDYAICFDTEDPECAAIRQVFPSHDT